MSEKPSRILVKEHISNEYNCRIARYITDADDFDDEFALMFGAGPNDSIKFMITSGGGSLDTCNLLTKAIRETQAHTIAYIGSTCASAATAIALACEEWEVDSQSSFMIHTASLGVFGKAPEIEVELAHKLKLVRRFIEDTYTGFLTPDEIEEVLRGQDKYFEGDELVARLTGYAEYRDALREAQRLDSQAEAA